VEKFSEASHTIATYSGIIHDNVYLSFVCYDNVDGEFDGGVICNVKGEKFDAWMM